MDMESNGGLTSVSTGPPPEQDIPLQIPKSVFIHFLLHEMIIFFSIHYHYFHFVNVIRKTKLFVEQTQRERDQVSVKI